jgi:hypothetical protein
MKEQPRKSLLTCRKMAVVCLTTLGFHANKPRGLHPSGLMVCTDPLPNERVPTSVARR